MQGHDYACIYTYSYYYLYAYSTIMLPCPLVLLVKELSCHVSVSRTHVHAS